MVQAGSEALTLRVAESLAKDVGRAMARLASSGNQGVLEGRSSSKEIVFPLPLSKGKGD